jgi:FKBP-type peptidyl-prolyl cis-trans isomerase SlyD
MSNDDAAEDVEESADAEAEAEEAEDETGLQEGDVIILAYTARTVEDGHLVDTTDPEVAEEEGVGEDQEFEPRTIALGHGHIFDPVEEDIIGKEAGDTGTVTVPAAEAFGEFEDDQVRTVSASKIDEEDRRPGAQVQIGGEQGIVETIVGGRARVDFNHPLAGDDIEYEYEVIEEVEDREEQAQGLLSMFVDVDLDIHFETDTVEEEQPVEPDADDDEDAEDEEPSEPEFETVEVEKESLYIEAVPQLQMDQQWMMQKQQIAQQLMDLVDVDRVVIQEIIDGAGMGMPGMMGGMGGMGGGGGGGIEEALEEADIDAEDLDMEDVEDVAEEIEDAQ